MLEIGASDPLWPDVHMGPEGAVRSFRALGGHGLLMPIHCGLFDLARHDWKEPIENVFAVKDLKLWSPEPGTASEVVRGEELRSKWWSRSEAATTASPSRSDEKLQVEDAFRSDLITSSPLRR